MRSLVAVILLAACGRPLPFPSKPLPELVSAGVPDAPIPLTALVLPHGESLIWSVHWKGLTIGRAELVVSDDNVRSRFTTDMLVSTVVKIQDELDTVLDRTAARPTSSAEKLVINGETRQVTTAFDGSSYAIDGRSTTVPGGNSGQTLHSALGALRAWAAPDARPGFLFIVHAGQLYRADVARPVAEELQGSPALRVQCRVHSVDDGLAPATVTLWLTADPPRTPVRIEVTNDDAHITAELIDTSAG